MLRRRFMAEDVSRSADKVVATLERAGIDPEHAIVLGGSALALAGIRPASDIDLMVSTDLFRSFHARRQTPGGLNVRPKRGANSPFLETIRSKLPPDIYGIDITLPNDPKSHELRPELDAKFLKHVAEFDRKNGYAYLPPQIVAAHKADIGRRKDRRDIKLIQKYLNSK